MTLPVSPPFGFGNGGSPPISSPSAGGLFPSPATRTIDFPLPEVLPIPDAREFNPEGDVDTGAIEANISIPGCSQIVPIGNLYVVRGISIYIDNMLTTTNVTFSLLANGVGVAGWTGLKMFPRVAPFVGNSFDAMIRGSGDVTLQMVYSNLDGGAYKVGASFSGWLWPVTSDQRWKQGGW